MHFKHPEILYFLFLLLIPILVHLFQLRRYKKEYFTNVKFLKELSIQTRKSSKLKKWLLLATRLLLLAFFILAFAQPFFKGKDSKNSNNELIIVLDNSHSMQAKGQNGVLLKRAIDDLIKLVPENKTFSLITNTESFYNVDIRSIQHELQNIDYSADAFDLESTMAKIKTIKSHTNRDLIIVTDGLGIQKNQLKSIDSTFNSYFVLVKAQQKNNTAIDSVYMNQISDDFLEVNILLKSYGESTQEIPVSLYNNNQLIAKTVSNLKEGNQTLNLTIPNEDFNGYVSITDNSLDYDNQFYFSISKPKKTEVLSIGSDENSSFLRKIYTEKEFVYKNHDYRSLNFNIIQNQDVIILNEISDIPESLQLTLKTFVEKGGNLIVIPSKENSKENLNQLFRNFGNITVNGELNQESLITKIAFGHPVFTNVFDKKVDNFQYPNVKFGFDISSIAPAVLSFDNGKPFLTAIQNKFNAVYIFSAPINNQNSNFQKSPLIVPTFYNMAQNMNNFGIKSYWTGNNTSIITDIEIGKDEVISVKKHETEDKESFIPQQQIQNNKVLLTFTDYPQKSGNFGLFAKDRLIENISFNFERTESDLNVFDSNTFENYQTANQIDSVLEKIQSDRNDNELWKLFLFLSILLIAIEILIQKFIK